MEKLWKIIHNCSVTARTRRSAPPPSARARGWLHPLPPGSPALGPGRAEAAIAQGRRRNQTTPEVQPCRSSLGHPIIGVPALLKLADWCRLRRERSQHGGSPCDTHRPDQFPPRPLKGRSPTPLTQLWKALTQSDRDRMLLTLSRVLAQQLPGLRTGKKVDREHA
jgi:hypothetical protein